VNILTEVLNQKVEFSFEEDICIFETIETSLCNSGVFKTEEGLKTVEDLLEEAREEEMKSRKEEDEEDMWSYEPLDNLLT
jgi:hypothetical protein